MAPSVCPFWSSGRFAWEERAGCFAIDAVPSVQITRGLSCFLMWLLVYVLSGLVEGLKSQSRAG